jgi:serine/threonine protein kinase/formylglycine-generating enzyme required for sulfatase activity
MGGARVSHEASVVRDSLGLVGATIDRRYRVERAVGEGGFAVVYQAEALSLGLPVALKVLRGELAHAAPSVRARFSQEAKLLARLRHPAIVELLDASTITADSLTYVGAPARPPVEDGTPYLVLAWIDGETLDARIMRVGPFSPPEMLRVLAPAIDAIAFAHGEGVIHRDLKPGNLMLGRVVDGSRNADVERMRVLDFGVARWAAESGVRTTTTSSSGLSIGYAAPEQYGKDFGPVDGRADQFALAAVAYSMLTGKAPFAGDSLTEVMFATCMSPKRPRVSEAIPALAGPIDAVIARALAIRPDERFADLRAFERALADAIDGRSTDVEAAASQTPSTTPGVLPTERESARPTMSERPLAPETLPTTGATGARAEAFAPTERAPGAQPLAAAPAIPPRALPTDAGLAPPSAPTSSVAASRRGAGGFALSLFALLALAGAAAYFTRSWLEATGDNATRHKADGGVADAPSTVTDAAAPTGCGTLAEGEVCVPAARVVRGPTDCGAVGDDAHRAACPAEEIFVAAFVLDAREVSVARWNACVAAKRCAPLAGSLVAGGGELPARGMRAKDADAFCAFERKRLPSDVEWERAAAGNARRAYPWGNARPDDKRAVFSASSETPRLAPSPVGSTVGGATDEGILDLAGNVAEWTSTRAPASAPTASSGEAGGPRRWVRGGSYRDGWDALRSWVRVATSEVDGDETIGLRCARSVGKP